MLKEPLSREFPSKWLLEPSELLLSLLWYKRNISATISAFETADDSLAFRNEEFKRKFTSKRSMKNVRAPVSILIQSCSYDLAISPYFPKTLFHFSFRLQHLGKEGRTYIESKDPREKSIDQDPTHDWESESNEIRVCFYVSPVQFQQDINQRNPKLLSSV